MSSEYALTGGRIFLGKDQGLQSDLALHIKGDKIVSVCPPAALPADIACVDVQHRAIFPGLIDVHLHSEDWHAPLLLANGITTVRDVGCALHPILDRRARWNQDDALAPRMVCCGPLLDGNPAGHIKMLHLVRTPEEGRAEVDSLVAAGVDQIKLYAWLDWLSFQAILDQAQQHHKFTLAHMMNLVDATSAINAGLNEIEHCSGCAEAMHPQRALAGEAWRKLFAEIDYDRMHRLIDALLEKDVWMAVTRIIWFKASNEGDPRHWDSPNLRYAPRPTQDWWKSRKSEQYTREFRLDWSRAWGGMQIFIAHLIERGVKIIAGSDAPFIHVLPGFGLHEELQLLVDAGMTPTEAIMAATASASQALQVDKQVGSIAPDKLADLVIVDGDPTQDIRYMQRIWRVVRGGSILDPAPLLDQAAAYAATAQLGSERRVNDIY
ncbi:MAG: hypothetical protein EXR62_18080 [Chloroflexi bacterium]|nr:hypothetical protein [Chloroflexota bacterium]